MLSVTNIGNKLQLLKQNHEEQGWQCKNGLPTEDVCCYWDGIYCDEENFITSIVLPDISAEGNITGVIERIPTLQYLDFRGNNFTSFELESFTKIDDKSNSTDKSALSASVNMKWGEKWTPKKFQGGCEENWD